MGRAFFSTAAVKSDPAPPLNPAYKTWSSTNNFDPDSDEFWDDAQEEKFFDNINVDQSDDPPSLHELLAEDPESSSSSSEGGDTDGDSPMAVGPDDPATLVPNGYVPVTQIWERIEPEPWNIVSSDWPDNDRDRATVQDLREHLSIAEGLRFARAAAAGSDINLPELVPISSPPATPRYVYPAMTTPSPAPTVTPRIYHWGHRSSVPSSPSSSPSRSGGPLTNPTARRSLARITPVRVRVHGLST